MGVGFLIAAFLAGPIGWLDLVIGLSALPAATTILLRLRGPDAPPLRWTGLYGHIVNFAIGAALLMVIPQPALLFYGTAMLLAAGHGYAGCELFAFANRINGRSDEIGCPVFSPIDAVERRSV